MQTMSYPPKSVSKVRFGCQNCRLRHLKCDELRPSCARCLKQGLTCERSSNNVRFRHGANPSVKTSKSGPDFVESQPWVKTTSNLVFIDDGQPFQSPFEQDDRLGSPVISNPVPRSVPQGAGPQSSHGDEGAFVPLQSGLHRSHSTGDMDMPVMEPRRRQVGSGEFVPMPLNSPSIVHSTRSPSTSWPYSPTSRMNTSPNNALTTSPSNRLSASEIVGDYLDYTSRVEVLEATASDTTYEENADNSESFGGIYLETSVFPLSSKEEAALLRYYIKRMARDFDLSDPQRSFRKTVPQRAATCPLLLNAIYALSARHLSRVADYDPLASNKYHQECLKRVIPMLNDSAAILDENLLASTIILRHLEEIEVPLSGFSPSDRQSHLLGSHALIKAQRHALDNEDLRQASFWVGLRQEIYVSFVNQRPIAITLDDLNIDRSSEPAADHIWSRRMVVLCADVMRHCFGEGDRSTQTFEALTTSVEDWYSYKNESFAPIYFKDHDEQNVFPDIWFAKDEVIIGWQHYYIAKLLLAAHDPKIPRLGPHRAAALRSIDAEIKGYVRVLCGIAMSNPDLAPNFTYASMSIVAAGDKFTELHEREALLHVLNLCDSRYGFPTGHARENLKAAWGWPQDDA